MRYSRLVSTTATGTPGTASSASSTNKDDDPVVEGRDVEGTEPDRGTVAEQQVARHTLAQDQRVHPEPQLVEQPVREQQPDDGPDAVLDDVLAGFRLEPGDRGDDVCLDDVGVTYVELMIFPMASSLARPGPPVVARMRCPALPRRRQPLLGLGGEGGRERVEPAEGARESHVIAVIARLHDLPLAHPDHEDARHPELRARHGARRS
jgi:hypothetical protein